MSGGLTKILDTKTFEPITYRPMPIGRYGVKVGERPIYGIPYLRNANMKPVDSRISNTPRLGQSSGLPDRRPTRKTGGEHGRSAVHHGGEVGDATPMEGGAMDIKKAIKLWKTIYSQMKPAEKSEGKKHNEAISKIAKVVDKLSPDLISKLKKSKTIQWLIKTAKKQSGSGELMVGDGFWNDLKRKAYKVGKAVSKGVKGAAKFTKGAAKVVGDIAGKAVPIATVIPGLQGLVPILESVAEGAKTVEDVAKKAQQFARTGQQESRKGLQKMRGDGLLGITNSVLNRTTKTIKDATFDPIGINDLKKKHRGGGLLGITNSVLNRTTKTIKDATFDPIGINDLKKKHRGGQDESAVNRFGITPGPRGNDKMSFVATHPMNYRKARLATLMRV